MHDRITAALTAEPDRRFALGELARAAGLTLERAAEGVAEALRAGQVARDGATIRRRIPSDPPPGPGDFLWLYREAAGLSQAAAARAAGMGQGQWCDLESNRRAPNLRTLRRAAAAVGRHVRELL